MAYEDTRVHATLDCLPASGLRSAEAEDKVVREIANVSRVTVLLETGPLPIVSRLTALDSTAAGQYCHKFVLVIVTSQVNADLTCLCTLQVVLVAIRLEYPHSYQSERQRQENDRAFRSRRRRGLGRHLQSEYADSRHGHRSSNSPTVFADLNNFAEGQAKRIALHVDKGAIARRVLLRRRPASP